MAHRVSITESICAGRLATSLETIILRTLVAQSVKDPTLSVLEIGTLFGVGLGIIHDITRAKFESTHLTVIDPFDGYYGQNKADIVTGQAVTEQQFRRNLKRVAVEADELSVIRAYSQDETAIAAASARTYNVLIIDGDHSGEGVMRDFNLYRPFVSQGGFIVFDDYGTDHWPEIKPAIDEHVLPLTDLEFIGAAFCTAIFRVR
jgi:cephalosporin hydroxylase